MRDRPSEMGNEMSEFKKYGHGDVVQVWIGRHGDWALSGWSDECVMCNRKIKNKESAFQVRFVNGDSEIHATNVDDSDIDMAGYMGWWYVGSECAKKFENGVLFKKEGE
jgi:hypothetical protein